MGGAGGGQVELGVVHVGAVDQDARRTRRPCASRCRRAVMVATLGHRVAQLGGRSLRVERPTPRARPDRSAGCRRARTASMRARAGVRVEPVGDLGGHPVGGGHLDGVDGEADRRPGAGRAVCGLGPLRVVARPGSARLTGAHGPQLEEGQVLGLVDDHVAVGGGHALDAGRGPRRRARRRRPRPARPRQVGVDVERRRGRRRLRSRLRTCAVVHGGQTARASLPTSAGGSPWRAASSSTKIRRLSRQGRVRRPTRLDELGDLLDADPLSTRP